MIEMLGVLAIIGVLSAGGILGYSKAMEAHKTNKFIKDISQMTIKAASIFQNLSGKGAGNVTALASFSELIGIGVILDEYKNYKTPFGTGVDIQVIERYDQFSWTPTFGVKPPAAHLFVDLRNFKDIPVAACVKILTYDWKQDFPIGTIAHFNNGVGFYLRRELPLTFSVAENVCNDKQNIELVLWIYFIGVRENL